MFPSTAIRARLHKASASVQSKRYFFASDIAHWNQWKQIESLQNGAAAHFWMTAFFSMRATVQPSSQHWLWVDANAWCKRALSQSTIVQKDATFTILFLRKSYEKLLIILPTCWQLKVVNVVDNWKWWTLLTTEGGERCWQLKLVNVVDNWRWWTRRLFTIPV